MIKKFNVDEVVYLLIEGPDSFIISSDDLIHAIYKPSDIVTLEGDMQFSDPNSEGWATFTQCKVYTLSLTEIRSKAVEIAPRDVVHYWGIKDRIRRNYHLLLGSMKEIGVSISAMPKWGE